MRSQETPGYEQLAEQRKLWSLERPHAMWVFGSGGGGGWNSSWFHGRFVRQQPSRSLCGHRINSMYFLGFFFFFLKIKENDVKHKPSSKMSGK